MANNLPQPTCVRVLFDGRVVAAGELPGETPGLHANPRELSRFGWGSASVLVRVEDATTGRAHEERVQLPDGGTGYVAAWVGRDSIVLRVYDSEPRWV